MQACVRVCGIVGATVQCVHVGSCPSLARLSLWPPVPDSAARLAGVVSLPVFDLLAQAQAVILDRFLWEWCQFVRKSFFKVLSLLLFSIFAYFFS